MIDVAIVGCGHMGRHHARAVAAHPDCRLVAAIDVVDERARAIADQYGAECRTTVPDGVDAVIIATPTSTHADVAGPLLTGGRWCLVEKPLAHTIGAAKALSSPRLVVGHIERFNPAVRAVGDLAPRFIEARRLAPATGRSSDVDVIFDLMIHDLDLILAWSRGRVEWFDAVGVAVDGPRVDTASVRLRTTDGIVANLVASRVAAASERTVRLFEPGRYTFLDLREGRAWRDGLQRDDGGVSERSGTPVPHVDARDALTAQWDAFIAAVRGDRAVAVGFDDGCGAVALAEQIGAAISGDSGS